PTATATFPFRYTVEYHLISENGPVPTYTETWNVPDTTATQNIADVVVTTTPVVNQAPPSMKGDLATSDGIGVVRLPAPTIPNLVLETDPTQATGLKYGSLSGQFDPSGAASSAQAAAATYTNQAVAQ